MVECLMRTFYDVTTGSPGKAPTEYDSKQWPREEPASAHYGMRPVYGNTRHRRNVPDNHVPQPFTPPPTPPLEWWEIPLDEAMPEQAPIQDVSYLCTQADLLLHADKAEWIKTQLRDGWATLCRAPSHRRVDRSVVITPQSSKGQAVRRQITWAKSMGYHYSNVLPVLPGTQVYRATGAIKYAYSRNDPDDPRSRSWKARGVMNGGIHAQPDGSSRADWTNNIDTAFHQQNQLEPAAILAKHKISQVVITDYEKWFCQLKRRYSEVPSNCMWFDGEYHWFSVYLFGEQVIPKLAHEYGQLLQLIILRELNARSKGQWFCQRRTDDQLFMPTDPTDIPLGVLIIKAVCKKAGAWLQNTKLQIGSALYDFDGRRWDLNRGPRGSVSLPPDKASHLVRELRAMRGGKTTRKQWEKAIGLLVWTIKIYPTTETHVHPIRKCFMAARHDDAIVKVSKEARLAMRRFETLLEGPAIWTDVRTFFEVDNTVSWYTDGSGFGGVGGFDANNHFSYKLPEEFNQHSARLAAVDLELSSAWIELVALLVAIYCLDTPAGTVAEWTTDSHPAFIAWKNHRSRSASINRIIASIDFACARRGIRVYSRWHRRTEPNAQLADDLSKFELVRFRSQTQQPGTAVRHAPAAVQRIIARSTSEP